MINTNPTELDENLSSEKSKTSDTKMFYKEWKSNLKVVFSIRLTYLLLSTAFSFFSTF